MAKGTFTIISESYRLAASNLFEYCADAMWIFKPILYPYAIIVALFLYLSALVFFVLIIFDLLARGVNAIRGGLLSTIEDRAYYVDDSIFNFLFNPLIIAILTPIFILSALIPKISSELDIDETSESALDQVDISGAGVFGRIIKIASNTISNLFGYIGEKNILLWPFLIVPCFFNMMMLLLLIAISCVFLILDLLSFIIDWIRLGCLKLSTNLGESVEDGFFRFVFSPILMVVLVPVFLFVLIVPKFSTGLDSMS